MIYPNDTGFNFVALNVMSQQLLDRFGDLMSFNQAKRSGFTLYNL